MVAEVEELKRVTSNHDTALGTLATRTKDLEAAMQEKIAHLEKELSKILQGMEERMKGLEEVAIQPKLAKVDETVTALIARMNRGEEAMLAMSNRLAS